MLPTDPDARKRLPIYSGVICYFPHALAAVAELSRVGNDQHNPGQPLHWAKEKSSDEPDALARHLTDMAIDPGHRDPDGVRAAVKLAWRALANLERMHDAGVDIFAVDVPVPVPAQADGVNSLSSFCPSCRLSWRFCTCHDVKFP
jgi:hypothetical protein